MKKSESYVVAVSKILVEQNNLKEDEARALQKAFKDRAEASFDDFLLEEGLIDRSDLLNALSSYYRVPSFDVVGHFFDHMLLTQFPKDLLLRSQMIPLQVDDTILIMIVAEPDNPELLDKIGEHVSYDVRFYVGLAQDITDAVKEFYELALTEVPNDDRLRQERDEEDVAREELLSDEDDY